MSVQCNWPPFMNTMFTDKSKLRIQFLKRVTQGTFQNLTVRFREEDFLGICSCSYSESSTHSPKPCLWKDQNSLTMF